MPEESNEAVKHSKRLKKVFKFFLVVFIVASAWVITLFFIQNSQNRTAQIESYIAESWQAVLDGNEQVVYQVEKAGSLGDFRELGLDVLQQSQLVRDEEDTVSSTIANLNKPPAALVAYQDLLAAYSEYLNDLKDLIDDENEITDEELDALNAKAAALRSKVETFRNAASFISRDLAASTYNLNRSIKDLRDADAEAKRAAEEETEKAEQEEASRQADEQSVREMVEKFAYAYVDGSETEVKRYLTDAYEKEFNYDVLKPESRVYWRPTAFRILDISRINDGQYEADLRITNTAWEDSTDQYFTDLSYVVVYDGGYQKWLIDREKI